MFVTDSRSVVSSMSSDLQRGKGPVARPGFPGRMLQPFSEKDSACCPSINQYASNPIAPPRLASQFPRDEMYNDCCPTCFSSFDHTQQPPLLSRDSRPGSFSLGKSSGGNGGGRISPSSELGDSPLPQGLDPLAMLAKAEDSTKKRLQNNLPENEKARLTQRLTNIAHLREVFQRNPSLALLHVKGWGEGCVGAKAGQGISEFDTFFVSDGASSYAVQLDSAYAIQIEKKTGITPLAVSGMSVTKGASDLSRSARVYAVSHSGLSSEYVYKSSVYRSVQNVAANRVPSEPVLQASPPVQRTTVMDMLRVAKAYKVQVRDPLVTDVLKNLVEKLGENGEQIAPLLDAKKTSSLCVIEAQKIHISFDASDEGWPLIQNLTADTDMVDFLKRMTHRDADWTIKWFFVFLNAMSGYGLFAFSVPEALRDQLEIAPTVAKSVFESLLNPSVSTAAMSKLQTLSPQAQGRVNDEYALFGGAQPQKSYSYQALFEVMKQSSKYLLILHAIQTGAQAHGKNPLDVLRAFAYQVKTWEKVSDRMGICCPSCSDGECEVPKPAQVITAVAVSTSATLPAIEEISSSEDIFPAVVRTLGAVMAKLGQDAGAVFVAIQAFSETLRREGLPADFHCASLMGYVLDSHDVLADYDPRDLLIAERRALLVLAKKAVSFITPEADAPYGLEVQTRICHLLNVLQSQGLVSLEEKRQYEALYPLFLSGEASKGYVSRYTTDYYEKATPRDLSRPVWEALRDVLKPLPIDILNGDLGSGKTTFSRQSVHRGVSVPQEGQLSNIFEIYNDITPGVDSVASVTHLSTFTLAKGAFGTLEALPGLTFDVVEAEKAYAKKEGDPTSLLSQETGCLCCTNRVGFAFRVGEVSRGLRGWGAEGIWTEITGIGDGSGAAGIGFWPGRAYIRSLSAVLNPVDARWDTVPDQGRGEAVLAYAQRLDAWFKADDGLQKGTPEHRLHKRQEILWAQLSMATHYFINLRAENPQDPTEQAKVAKMSRLIQAKLVLEEREADLIIANFKYMRRWEAGVPTWDQMAALNPKEVFNLGKTFAFSKLEKDMGESEAVASGMEPRSMKLTLTPNKRNVGQLWQQFCDKISEMSTSGENRQIDRLKGYVKIVQPHGMTSEAFKEALRAQTAGIAVHDTDGGVFVEVEVGAGALMWVGGIPF